MSMSEFHLLSNNNLKCSEKVRAGLGNMKLMKNNTQTLLITSIWYLGYFPIDRDMAKRRC